MKRNSYHHLASSMASFWGRLLLRSTGSVVIIEGRENLPDHRNICFISNHQGLFDIPVLLGFLGTELGFIAKQELFKIPILSYWMKELNCIFINRKSARDAIKSFETGAKIIRSGYPIVIFPEGTRSKSNQVAPFHYGSLKLAIMSEADIVPITICGTWKIFEKDHRIRPQTIKISILEPIPFEKYHILDKQQLMDGIRMNMQANLDHQL